jgi:hypothetical protein
LLNPDGYHVAGYIEATTARAIGDALAALPHRRFEVWSEVLIESADWGFAIYPTRTVAGGEDFLVGGNIWLPVDAAREVVRAIGALLDRAGLKYQLELTVDGVDEKYGNL